MMLFPNFWFQVNPDINNLNTAAYRILPEKYFFFFLISFQHVYYNRRCWFRIFGFRSIRIIMFRIPQNTAFYWENIYSLFFNISSTCIWSSMMLIPNFRFQVISDSNFPNTEYIAFYLGKFFSNFSIFFHPVIGYRWCWFRIFWFQINPDYNFPNTAEYRIYRENFFSYFLIYLHPVYGHRWCLFQIFGFRSIRIIIFRILQNTEFYSENIYSLFFNISSTFEWSSVMLIPNFRFQVISD